jgi:putative heme-binding domain-containing protein
MKRCVFLTVFLSALACGLTTYNLVPRSSAADSTTDSTVALLQKKAKPKGKRKKKKEPAVKKAPAGKALREPTATPLASIKVKKGFKVELLYSVPKATQGSWVNMTVDPKGRLIVSDQYGKLYRVTPPAIGKKNAKIQIEPINVDIGEAQGLLWAFDSLYVVVNTGGKYKSGLYRVKDTDGDDTLDSVETLRILDGGREHGPHAILLSPDGKSLYVVAGDATKLPSFDSSRVPETWDEDLLLPRIYGRGFMKGTPAPGGWICNIDPEGKRWDLVTVGYRNQFDAAFNRDGELFTYDADMEWDINTPWYRPTRINHCVSGSDYGWRNGSGKWPAYYEDSLPAVVNVGPGCPTGIVFGYGAKFPGKYQNSLFMCDWSYGKLYAAHLTPKGASYTATLEEFITGVPLPLTDVVVNPHDGAMYFTIGGRKVQSGLYRVTYVGNESTNAVKTDDTGAMARKTRRQLESFHGTKNPKAIEAAWEYLGSDDRFLRHAARTAVEHQEPKLWQARALAEKNPVARISAMIALARVGDESLKPQILQSLGRISWKPLSHHQKLALVRAYGLVLTRMGEPSEAQRKALITRLDPVFPAQSAPLNSRLTELLVYLQAPNTAAKAMKLLAASPTQEEQIDYTKSLRLLKTGWTPKLREDYFRWFLKAGGYRGGASFGQFVSYIKTDAVAGLSAKEKAALKPILEAKPQTGTTPLIAKTRPFVKKWTMAEILPLVQDGLTGRDFDRGRQLFGETKCFACHRFDNEGGAFGPDLTILSGRFSSRDLLESVLEPNKVITDQYAAVTIVTIDGKIINGRIINLAGDSYRVNTDMLDPNAMTIVDRKRIEEMVPSKTSVMPTGLLDVLKKDEILDLMAYLLSRGDRSHVMFGKGGR